MSCCDDLKNEIASLRADIAALDNKYVLKTEKPNIVNESIKGAQNLIVPIIGTTVAVAISPLAAQISTAVSLANSATAAAAAATAAAQSAASAAATALAKLAGIAAQIAAILGVIATLQVLGARIDAVEGGLNALGNDVSKILGLIFPIKSQAERAEGKADSALSRIPPIDSTANRAFSNAQDALIAARGANNKADAANSTANQAIAKVNEVDQKIGGVSAKADAANSTANQAITKVNEVDQKIGGVSAKADAANSTANQAIAKVNEVDQKIGGVSAKADAANSTANQAITKVNEVDQKIGGVSAKADAANSTANQAIAKVNEVDQKIGGVSAKADAANSTANQAITKVNEVDQKIGGVSAKADAANSKADTALSRIGTIAQELPGIRDIATQAKAAVTSLTNVVNNLQSTVNYILNKINNLTNNILNNITNTFNTYVTNNITNLVNETMGNIDLSPVLSRLTAIDAKLAGLTAIPAATVLAISTSPAFRQVATSAAAAGTCQTLQPGNCGNTAIQNIGNNLSNNLFNRLEKLFNTGANAAQLALLNVINNKLGVQMIGGLSGWMQRFSSWSVTQQALNILTTAATIHNAMMLSNNIGLTLIQAMQNVLNLVGLKDSEGADYDLSAIIRGNIENFLKTVLGAENFAALSAAWKAANRIYQSAGNLFSSLLNMGDTMTQALTVIGGQTGKIGNALRAWGVVSEKAYGWMNPSPNFNNPVLTKLQSLNDTASIVETVSTQPLTVKSAKEELEEASAQLQKDIGQFPGEKISITIPEASKVKSEQDSAKSVSVGKEITEQDLEAD
ncbi:hypothetical protein IQ227_07240 [Anabaena aphanizomenioides LEGE 00250]|uniref:Uncharacterized protein n=1 Tax=Sphaerospermopsis aphanizomenoides LEGE 00250 TaxID=2777972 RepID=A0ABR9VCB7_9CYAN|nr:hypothetical protein [Sphaerospermopsis aphanizomenoides]MBE9235835.1 hypothetical protein [Sphaerospermopsis aphanizomenoides LEGE 00250]